MLLTYFLIKRFVLKTSNLSVAGIPIKAFTQKPNDLKMNGRRKQKTPNTEGAIFAKKFRHISQVNF